MSTTQMKIAAVAAVIGGMMAGAVTASAALNLPTQNCAYMFNTNMRLGSTGTDVKNLQKMLNAWPQTQVSVSGAGSPGMETTYFGAATRAAVNKFHALHLVELGITAPTGNVYAGTRALLNAACNGTVSTIPGNTTSGPVSAMLSASQPTGMIVQGQAGARLADITFTGNGTVTSVQLQRTGVSTDSTLTNVYLYDGNTRITDAASVVTGGYINFNSPTGLFSVSGSRTLTVRADISSTAQGQSVGVRLNSVTAGGAVSTFSNVVGNNLQVANVTVATVTVATTSVSSTVQPGTVNQTVWSATVSVGTRDVNLRAATYKFVGSAPTDSIANLNLFVDGVKVSGPSVVNTMNNNKVTFDLGATPYLMKTGGHTVEVRGDIIKGSNRTYQFSIENAADLMLEDTNLMGVNVTPTLTNGTTAITQSNTAATQVTISLGSVTANLDPSFNATKVTGGATNVPVGQWTLKAYGEDVKVNSLQVNFSNTTATSVNNVSLYVNGGQVGTSQNYRGSALSYNLGSSLIIPAGQTVTLTVKADIVDANNAAWSSGTILAQLGGVSNNAQGQSSNELISVASSAVNGNSLTVSSGSGTFARMSGFSNVTVSPNTSGVKIGSFTLQANSAESINITSIGVNPTITNGSITNYSNLRVMSNGAVVGTPVGNPSTGTTTFSFPQMTIPANGSQTFDVYADVGSDVDATIYTDMGITYRGSISNTTTTSGATGSSAVVTSAVSSLANSSLSASSPISQFVVGGSTFGIASFKVSTSGSGTVANVRELRFYSTSTDAIESVTVGGVTAPMVSGTSTVTGLNIPVVSTGTDIPVTVKFSGYQNTTTGGSLATTVGAVQLNLSYVEATSGSGSVITKGNIVASNSMTDVASKPTVVMAGASGNTTSGSFLTLGVENKLAEFTVTADANGKIAVATATLTLGCGNVTNCQFSSLRVADGSATIPNTAVTGSSTAVVNFNTAYEIGAGQSKTFTVYGIVAGTAPTSGTAYVTSQLTSGATFFWKDVIGGNTVETGAAIYNFPTTGYSTRTQ
jgi:hypothetical protein